MKPGSHGAPFPATQWSVVLAAAGSTSPESDRALETLCVAYWPPIYAYLRRTGHPPEDARDRTQAFFARLLVGDSLGSADAARGRFRSYLLGALKHFLADAHDRESAGKRGGGREILSLNADQGEETYSWEPSDRQTPETLFERRWALSLMARVLDRLHEECELAGKQRLFAQLKAFLTEAVASTTYPEAARALGMTEANVRMLVTRLRRRYGELLRAEIALTVGSQAEVEDEMRHLLAVLRAG